MSHSHVICNQLGHWWGRGKRWVDGRESARIVHWPHRDEAVNTLFELSSQDVELRGEIIEVELVDGQLPALPVSSVPLPDAEGNPELGLENAVSDHSIEWGPSGAP